MQIDHENVSQHSVVYIPLSETTTTNMGSWILYLSLLIQCAFSRWQDKLVNENRFLIYEVGLLKNLHWQSSFIFVKVEQELPTCSL